MARAGPVPYDVCMGEIPPRCTKEMKITFIAEIDGCSFEVNAISNGTDSWNMHLDSDPAFDQYYTSDVFDWIKESTQPLT